MDNNWRPVKDDHLKAILESATQRASKFSFDASTTMCENRALPFYDNVLLYRLKDPDWEPKNVFLYFLTLDGDIFNPYWLNGTAPPIHEVNQKAPIKLSDQVVLDYLRFFCFFVRAEEGPFVVAESMEDTYMPKIIDDKTKAVLEATLRPAYFDSRDDEGNWICDAVVYYSNALFVANFVIKESGMVEMEDDEPIAADLPVKIDAPVS